MSNIFNLTDITSIDILLSRVQEWFPYGEAVTLIFIIAPLIYSVMKGYNFRVSIPASLFSGVMVGTAIIGLGIITGGVGLINPDFVVSIVVLFVLSLFLLFM